MTKPTPTMPAAEARARRMALAHAQALPRRAAIDGAQYTQAKARVHFLDWLNRTHPDVFEDAVSYAMTRPGGRKEFAFKLAREAGISTNGLGLWEGLTDSLTAGFETISEPVATTVEEKSTWQKIVDGAITFGTGYLSYQAQKDLLELNIERAKQGLPPLDSTAGAPVVRTQVEIDPALARDVASNIGSSINRNVLIIGGVAMVVLFMAMRR